MRYITDFFSVKQQIKYTHLLLLLKPTEIPAIITFVVQTRISCLRSIIAFHFVCHNSFQFPAAEHRIRRRFSVSKPPSTCAMRVSPTAARRSA